MVTEPKGWNDWWLEMENFSSRSERAFDTLGERAGEWCFAAYKAGREASIAPYVEALRACRAWHYAEQHGLASFSQRSDLCAYSEWKTQVALQMTDADYKPVPVIFGRPTDGETLSSWVDELIADETAKADALLENAK